MSSRVNSYGGTAIRNNPRVAEASYEFNRRPDFCDRFGYPAEVRGHFRQILACLPLSEVRSVLLFGSAARGELTYRADTAVLQLWSDYEFLVVMRGTRFQQIAHETRARLDRLEQQIGAGSPLFHIDCAFLTIRRLRALPHILRTYETREVGITLWGEELRSELPRITYETLDFRDLNEVLLWRLWSMLLYFPSEWLRLPQTEREGFAEVGTFYCYVLARNALDLTTWLLPREHVMLTSFRERVSYIQTHYASLRLGKVMGTEFPAFLESCLATKLHLIPMDRPLGLYEETVGYFGRALEDMTRVPLVQALDAVVERSSTFYCDRHWRTKVRGMRTATRHMRVSNALELGIWVMRDKYGLILRALYNMHRAALAWIQGRPEAAAHLEDVRRVVAVVSFPGQMDKSGPTQPFPAAWLMAREQLADALMDFFPSLAVKKPYIVRTLNNNP